MTANFTNDMGQLHRDILTMYSTVEELIHDAVRGLQAHSFDMADELIVRDHEVDKLDISIEEECLRILALYQPVANDLRRVTAVLKIIGELERVGDLAVKIAERSRDISSYPHFPLPDRLDEMATEALSMLHGSIDAYVELDARKARSVCLRDDGVDALNYELINQLRIDMVANSDLVEPGIHLFSVIRHLERVADHATNIAEDVVYLVDGEIIRHPSVRRPQAN